MDDVRPAPQSGPPRLTGGPARPLVDYGDEIKAYGDRCGMGVCPLSFCTSDGRCRLEHMERLRRKLEPPEAQAMATGRAPLISFAPDRPWDSVWAAAVAENEFWRKEFEEPALHVLSEAGRLVDMLDGDLAIARRPRRQRGRPGLQQAVGGVEAPEAPRRGLAGQALPYHLGFWRLIRTQPPAALVVPAVPVQMLQRRAPHVAHHQQGLCPVEGQSCRDCKEPARSGEFMRSTSFRMRASNSPSGSITACISCPIFALAHSVIASQVLRPRFADDCSLL